MSVDLQLTESGDLLVENGDLVLATDDTEVAQSCKIRLLFWLGEWILDVSDGTPWLEDIFPPYVSQEKREQAIKKRIMGTEHIKQLVKFTAEYTGHNMNVSFVATSDFGDVFVEVRT